MELILLGATGQVGTALTQLAAESHAAAGAGRIHVRSITRAELDLSAPSLDAGAVRAALFPTPPTPQSVIVNLAAFTAVDDAEDPARAEEVWQINAVAPGLLAELGVPLIHVSTDYVFDGELERGLEYPTDAPTNPLNAYGRSKLAGERAALAAGSHAHVIRTSWVYSGPRQPGRDFVKTMLSLAERGIDPAVVDDQFGRPTHAGVLASGSMAAALRLAAGGELPGVLHLTGGGPVTTWCGFAREIFAAAGHDPDRVRPVPSSEYPTPARRPHNSALSLDGWTAAGLPSPPAWRESLGRALE